MMGGISIWQLIILLAFLSVYLIPSMIALARSHPKKGLIVLLNVIGGVFLIGWVAALIWSLVIPKEKSSEF